MEVTCPYDLTSLPVLIGVGTLMLGFILIVLTLRSIVRSRLLPTNFVGGGLQIVGLAGGLLCLLFGFDLAIYQEVWIVDFPTVQGQELVERTCQERR